MKKLAYILVLLLFITACKAKKQNPDKIVSTNEKIDKVKKTDKVDYRLNDIWALKTINGEEVNENLKKAYIEFNLTTNKVYGNTGCNSLSGDLYIEGNTITLSKMAVTEMYCVDYNNEQDFLTPLNQPMTYKIFELKLTLKSYGKTLVFQKGD